MRELHPPLRVVDIEDHAPVTIEWNAKLGRLQEGYARGGDHVKGKIRIARGQTRRASRIVVLHEVMHELWGACGLDQWLSTRTEELVIDTLSMELLDVLRRNPALVEFLTEET